MSTISFGYNDAVDYDLRDPENYRWHYEGCVIFLRSVDKTITDRFRIVDVAIAAERVVSQCMDGKKHSVEGITDVGSRRDRFFVGVGGKVNLGIGQRE